METNDEQFSVVLNQVVAERTNALRISCPLLAEKLGQNYRSFMHRLERERRFPAELVPRLCCELKDYRLLDYLERQAGRVGYHLPDVSRLPRTEDVQAVQRLVKEVSEALGELAKTLEDGVVESHEVERTIPELDDVVRECVRLKHWLQARCEADKQKARRRGQV